MKSAIRIGLKPYEADMLTIHELNLMIIDYTEKLKENKKSGIITAFYSAYFSKHEKLSGDDLNKVLDSIDNGQAQEMSDDQMFAAAKRIAAAFGG